MLSTGPNKHQARLHSRLQYSPALDGLRAIAVIGVLLYHAEIPAFRGGFLGVDVFFVISGYLISSLLLGEWQQSGNIDLRAFWLRRARRLLPALFLLLGAVLIFSVFFLQDEVARLRNDATAAFGYSTNWYLIFNEQSYFEAAGRPSLFQHLWSLAVEEQFYLLWPIVLVALLKFARRFALPIVVGGVIMSALLMGLLYSPEVDPSRIYYGTDTRAAGLLVGVALAFLLQRLSVTAKLSAARAWVLDALGGITLATVLAFFVFASELEPFFFIGGFLILEVLVAGLIATITMPGGRFLPLLLGSRIPRWIGLRSYGIYLWHWPVFMLTRPRVDVEFDGIPLLALRLVVTLVLAELSYRFVETPIRQGALQRIWRDFRVPTERRGNLLNLRLAATFATLLILAATLGPPIVSAKPPTVPDYLTTESINTVDPALAADSSLLLDASDAETPKAVLATVTLTAHPTVELVATSTSAPIETPSVEVIRTSISTSTATAVATVETVPTATATATATASTEPTSTQTPEATATVTIPITPLLDEEPIPNAVPTAESPFVTDDDGYVAPTETPFVETTSTPEKVPTETVGESITPLSSPTSPFPSPTIGTTPVPGDIQSLGKIVAIGDSVMLGAAKELTKVIPNIAIDAKVSRQESATISLLSTYKNNGVLGDVVVIHIGNNGTITTKQFDQIMTILADRKWVVFVNLAVPRKWEAPNNTVLADGVARYPNTVLVDWHSASVNHRDYFAADGFHLQVKGQQVYAALILDKLRTLVTP